MSSKTVKDLPLYPDEKRTTSNNTLWVNIESPRSPLETAISNFRQSGCQFMQQFKSQKEKTTEFVDQTKNKVNFQLEYIRSETNLVPKVVFISLSGLSGLLIGFRKSKFKKFLYTSMMTVGSTSLCYPKEAKIYYDKAYIASKSTATNFYRDFIWPSENKLKNKSNKLEKDELARVENGKDKVIKLNNQEIESTKTGIIMKGDKGQASDDDKEMYTNRTK